MVALSSCTPEREKSATLSEIIPQLKILKQEIMCLTLELILRKLNFSLKQKNILMIKIVVHIFRK